MTSVLILTADELFRVEYATRALAEAWARLHAELGDVARRAHRPVSAA